MASLRLGNVYFLLIILRVLKIACLIVAGFFYLLSIYIYIYIYIMPRDAYNEMWCLPLLVGFHAKPAWSTHHASSNVRYIR